MFNQDTVRDSIAIVLTIAFAILMVWKGSAPQEFMDVYMIVLGFFFSAKFTSSQSPTIITPSLSVTSTTEAPKTGV